MRPSAADFKHHQDSLKILGIYRVSADRCEMTFFSGGVLKTPLDRRCRIDLTLDAAGAPACERIMLFRDGRRVGPMTQAPSLRMDERVCSFPLGVTAERLVQAYFLFEPVPWRSRDWLRQTPRYGMKRLAAVCDGE